MTNKDASLNPYLASGPASSLPTPKPPKKQKDVMSTNHAEIKDMLQNHFDMLTHLTTKVEKIELNQSNSTEINQQELQLMKKRMVAVNKANNIITEPINHSLTLHSFPTTAELRTIGSSIHLPDCSPWIDINQKAWHIRNSHAHLLADAAGPVAAVIHIKQLPPRQFKNKTVYPANIYFNSTLQREFAAKHMMHNKKVNGAPAIIQYSLQDFPDLQRSTKWITSILNKKKRENWISNYKIDNFVTCGPEQNFIAPLYSIQKERGGKWSKTKDCDIYTTALFTKGLSFPEDEDGNSQIHQQFETVISQHINHIIATDLDNQQTSKSYAQVASKPKQTKPTSSRFGEHFDKPIVKRKHSNNSEYSPSKKPAYKETAHHCSNTPQQSSALIATTQPTPPTSQLHQTVPALQPLMPQNQQHMIQHQPPPMLTPQAPLPAPPPPPPQQQQDGYTAATAHQHQLIPHHNASANTAQQQFQQLPTSVPDHHILHQTAAVLQLQQQQQHQQLQKHLALHNSAIPQNQLPGFNMNPS